MVAVGNALSSVHAGVDKLAIRKLEEPRVLPLEVRSSMFAPGGPLPALGETPPPISWGEVPAGTQSIAVIVEDPDAPLPKPFVHWLVYGILPTVREMDLATAKYYREGRNSHLRIGYAAPAPPPGHGVHNYHFQVFALDTPLELPPGEGHSALLRAMKGHVLACGDLIGTFYRR